MRLYFYIKNNLFSFFFFAANVVWSIRRSHVFAFSLFFPSGQSRTRRYRYRGFSLLLIYIYHNVITIYREPAFQVWALVGPPLSLIIISLIAEPDARFSSMGVLPWVYENGLVASRVSPYCTYSLFTHHHQRANEIILCTNRVNRSTTTTATAVNIKYYYNPIIYIQPNVLKQVSKLCI